jgi:hypothetical protein
METYYKAKVRGHKRSTSRVLRLYEGHFKVKPVRELKPSIDGSRRFAYELTETGAYGKIPKKKYSGEWELQKNASGNGYYVFKEIK